MNFLAHCALAQDAGEIWQLDQEHITGLLAGALIGDFVKGPIPLEWPQPLRIGVQVHRKIDANSNQDPFGKACSNRFPQSLRRFAPIFVDLIADHHLCSNWQSHYPHRSLDLFAQRCYAAIAYYETYLGDQGSRFFSYMQDENLLCHYDQWAHVERGLHSVMRRLNRRELSQQVVNTCIEVLDDCQADCGALHHQLQQHWHVWQPDGI